MILTIYFVEFDFVSPMYMISAPILSMKHRLSAAYNMNYSLIAETKYENNINCTIIKNVKLF